MIKHKLSNILIMSFLISLICTLCFANDKKPTLLVFSADWCKYCIKAKKDIDNHEDLSDIIKKYDVVVADFDVDKDLVDGYNIQKIPTFVVINGTNISKKVGYNGPKDLSEFLSKLTGE